MLANVVHSTGEQCFRSYIESQDSYLINDASMDLCDTGVPRYADQSIDYFAMPQWFDSSEVANPAFSIEDQLLKRTKNGTRYVPFDDGRYMLNGACYHGEINH